MKPILLAAVLCLGSVSARADWNIEPVKDVAKLKTICRLRDASDGPAEFSDDYTAGQILTNLGTTVTVCRQASDKLGYLTSQYVIKYHAKKSKSVILHSESEMMAWGAQVRPLQKDFRLDLYFPVARPIRRKAREFLIHCDQTCELTEKCVIQHLPSDLPLAALLADVHSKTKNVSSRGRFVMDGRPKDTLELNQLFFEALAGNAEAASALKGLSEGQDGAWGETISGYLGFVEELKDKGCHWGK